MKQTTKREFPPGWDARKMRALIAHYDQQTEEEGAAEIEKAPEAPGKTWISIPTELIAAVNRLIEEHERNGKATRSPTRTKKGRTSKARE